MGRAVAAAPARVYDAPHIGGSATAMAESPNTRAMGVYTMLSIIRGRRTAAPNPFDRRGYLRSPVTYPSYRRGLAPPNKGMSLKPEPLSPEELLALLVACGTGTAGNRNRALLTLGAHAGLRCAEALALRPVDVDLARGRVHVLHGKGDRDRFTHLNPGACALVERWARERAALGFGPGGPLICVIVGPTAGAAVNAPYVRALMKQLQAHAGIQRRVHFHGLRHTYAAHMLDAGAPIHVIRAMLGHSSIAMTERYADHISPARALAAAAEIPWPDHAAALQRSQSEVSA